MAEKKVMPAQEQGFPGKESEMHPRPRYQAPSYHAAGKLRNQAALISGGDSEGAIHAFSKSLAESLVERKIRVNCVAPGPIWTPLIPATSAKKAAQHGVRFPCSDLASRRKSRRRMCSSRPTLNPATSPGRCWPLRVVKRRGG